MTRVLIVDDERAIREGLSSLLNDAGYDTVSADGAEQALRAADGVDVVLLDVRMTDGNGLTVLRELKRAHPALPVIMATACSDSETTIGAMTRGAFDYVTKPFDTQQLLAVVERAARRPSPTTATDDAAVDDNTMVGTSPAMLAVWKAIGRAATSDATVLITGETGVGKELVAQAIHSHSDRRQRPCIAVNLAAVPATLVESELFGHERGAFTGAIARREGRFEQAGAGTLFLDEIGDLDAALQTKLLRVLQDGFFERVGGQQRLQSRARIIAATSRPELLRPDLAYRLAVIRIDVPPLRQRRQDIAVLVDWYLRRQRPRRAVTAAAMAALQAGHWPGNVRELLHTVQQAVLMTGAEVLDATDFPSLATVATAADAPADPADDVSTLAELDLPAQLAALERKLILEALRRAAGNRTEAARLLRIRRQQLYARMKELAIVTSSETDA